MRDEIELSIVIPCFNEAPSLSVLVTRINEAVAPLHISFEIILVDDGSTDGSWQAILRLNETFPQVRGILLSRNFGQQAALVAGLQAARGKVVATMDADLQDPPDLLPEMYQKIKDGSSIVYAQRQRRDGDPLTKRIFAHLFYSVIQRVTDLQIPQNVGEYRMAERRVIKAVLSLGERRIFLRGMFAWVGFPFSFVTYNRPSRYAGEAKFTFWKSLLLAQDAFISFSRYSLHQLSLAASAFMFGILLICIGVLFSLAVISLSQVVLLGSLILGLCALIQGLTILLAGGILKRDDSRPLFIVQDRVGAVNERKIQVAQETLRSVVGS